MNRVVLPSLAVGWVGSLASWVTAAHPIFSLLATVLAATASIYAIRVSWGTARLRRLEIARTIRALCDQCREGNPPQRCPIPADQRPSFCPDRNS